ncbi:hypothetical protein JZ751_000975 [Albula glossodonta]|uniref:Cadherin domain-containing protein n=1 Tax=Albula glossodonta TaxID=121402 RepID=A0A8T2PXW8_9TELE|nr:hypothetical protein JZ751_000975 [Albula glossodonta]
MSIQMVRLRSCFFKHTPTSADRSARTNRGQTKQGVIRTALMNMDREAREQYAVVIQAKDMAGQVGGLSGSTTVNVTLTDVNDNPPKFPQSPKCLPGIHRAVTFAFTSVPPLPLSPVWGGFRGKNYQLYVPESAQVGKAVGKIRANDEDLGINADMAYSITNAEGAAAFSIAADRDKREGVISLKQVSPTFVCHHSICAFVSRPLRSVFFLQPLNFEKKKAYTLHIEGSNTHLDPRFSHLGPFKDHTTLKIIVGDVDEPPVFSMDYYIMDVYENAAIGTEVGAVTARDPDSTNSAVRLRGQQLYWDYSDSPECVPTGSTERQGHRNRDGHHDNAATSF